MAGTKLGGQRAAATNKQKYGLDFYRRIGVEGGSRKGAPKGFASSIVGPDGMTGKQRASVVGVIGGQTSRRTKREAK